MIGFTSGHYENTNQLTLGCTKMVTVWNDKDLATTGLQFFGNDPNWDSFNFRNINDCLRNYRNTVGDPVSSLNFTSGFLDLLAFNNIYISSANLGTF